MPEQSVHHQKETDSDQQQIKGDVIYENNRYRCSGRIQCRN